LLHVIVLPQPSLAVPLQRFAHGFAIGVHPQPFGPAPPPPHSFGVTHVSGHVTTCPQLFVLCPHPTPAHVVASGSGVQHVVPLHTPPEGQPEGQPTSCPQLFLTTTPPHRPLHALPSSRQHDPSGLQVAPALAQAPPFPHATVCPQLFVAVPHFLPAHVVATGSGTQPHALFVHRSPFGHPPQSTGRPQLSSVGPQRF
jgi:hypothetical protein